MVHLVLVGPLKWNFQKAGLWAILGSFCLQGMLQQRSVIAHYQIVQGGQTCCCKTAKQHLSDCTDTTLAGQLLPQHGGPIQWLAIPQLSDCGSLPHPQSPGLVQDSNLSPLSEVSYIHCLCSAVLFRGEWNLPMSWTGICC
jgi:hypothetical protein